jgi:hypothetical protein
MDAYVQEVRKLESNFSSLEVHHVLREHNVGADILSKLGSTRAQVLPGVFVQELKQPSIKSSPQVTIDVEPQQPDREVMVLGIRRYHDRNIRERSFSVGDLVLHRIHDKSGLHKLNSRWEGPFVVKQVTRPGSYRLQYPEGQDVPNSWNIQNLRKFYP